MFKSKDLLVFWFKYFLVIISVVRDGSCSKNNQTIRFSTLAPSFVGNENSSNITQPIPTQQTSDTFLIGDAMVPPNHKDMYVSPFTKPQLKEQLLPIIGAKVREQFEGFLEDVDDGLDFIKNIFTVKQNVVKNLAYKVKNRIPLVPPLISPQYQIDPRQKYKIPDFQPTITTRIRINTKKPYYRYAKTGAISHACDDPIKCKQRQQWPKFPNEVEGNGYKELEESILKKLEKIEEKKVEATLGTLVNKRESDIIKGKPYGFSNEWKPVSYHNQYQDTKSSGSGKVKVSSQLNTSFKGTSAPVTVVGPSEPYPIVKKPFKSPKKTKNSQKTAKVKVYPSQSPKSQAYGSIQEIIASTAGTGYAHEIQYDNHITHAKPETDFVPLLHRPTIDSDLNASKNNEVSVKNEKKPISQKKRKTNPSRTTPKPTTDTPSTTSTRNSLFRWPKVSSSDAASSPSESKVLKVFVSSGKSLSTTRNQTKRPLAERLVSTASDALPAITKSPYVDRVRKTGFRGKVKFNSILNET